jgi:vacuolar-type H+-ATPase subunit I/STV1
VAQVNSLRGDIGGIINNIKGTYDSIFGTAQNTANEQNQTLTQNYAKTIGNINDQASEGQQSTGNAYASRGIQDSSFYGNAVDKIKKEATKQIGSAGDELKNNQASLGGFVSQQEATRNAQKQGLDSILNHISQSNDPNELTSLRNTLTTRLADLQSSAADVQSNKQYLSKLTSVSPVSERLSALNNVIGNIVNGAASSGLKQAIGMSFIQNSGLDDATQQQLIG